MKFKLRNFKIFRFLLGGIWLKIDGEFHKAEVFMVSSSGDGSKYVSYTVDGSSRYLHETHNSIQAIERFYK